MKNLGILWMIMLLAAAPASCFAADNEQLTRENAELRQRVDKLEKELAELRQIVMQRNKNARLAQQKPAVKPELSEAEVQKIMTMVKNNMGQRKSVWSNLDIQLYGYLKADASYDTSRTDTGNYVVWVDSEAGNKNDNEFNLTGKETRLGMRLTGPEDDGLLTSGRVEVDFYGSNGAENKAKIQLRHAYIKLDWPEDKFSILAGQTSDVISPLVPHTLNYTVLWDVGNIGYRRPQIRLTKGFSLGGDVDLKLEGAIARTIGRTSPTGSESGEDAGFPSLQGRTSLTFPWFGPKPTTVGFSGHWGREDYDVTGSGNSKKFHSWSVNLDLTQPVNKWLTVKGELFNGENLNTYFGGIGQGVNTTRLNEIGTKGGWIAATLGPWTKWSFNLGTGVDDVDSGDLNYGDRTLNRSIFANAIYSVNENTEIGLELSQWHTEYKNQTDADSLRAQTSFIYKF